MSRTIAEALKAQNVLQQIIPPHYHINVDSLQVLTSSPLFSRKHHKIFRILSFHWICLLWHFPCFVIRFMWLFWIWESYTVSQMEQALFYRNLLDPNPLVFSSWTFTAHTSSTYNIRGKSSLQNCSIRKCHCSEKLLLKRKFHWDRTFQKYKLLKLFSNLC